MDPDILRLAQLLFVAGLFTVVIGLAAVVVKLAFRWPGPRRLPTESRTPGIDESRFARLEEAVDGIAIEVERIAEAQRFSVKLLSERATERSAGESSPPARRNATDSR